MWARRKRRLMSRYRVSRHRKPRNHHRNRGYAVGELDDLKKSNPNAFERMFRMDAASFDELVEILDPMLRKDEKYAIISSGSAISTSTRLAVTLRWLSGGSYIDICFAWGVSKSSFYSERGVLWPTIRALDDVLKLGLPICDRNVLEELSTGFKEHSGGVFDGCIMAIDGMAVRARCPYSHEVKYTKCWRLRKGGYGIIVMAGCDVNARFWSVTANDSGSTHDSQAWANSALADAIHNGKLDNRYFIIGDEAFCNSQQLLTPYPGRGLGEWRDSFNFWLSHSRQAIERAFGMLVQRWGIFWRPFTFSFERWPLVIILCCKLHNFCLDRNAKIPKRRCDEDHVPGDLPVVYDNNDAVCDIMCSQRSRGSRRQEITDKLEVEGRRRPPHALCNSRQ